MRAAQHMPPRTGVESFPDVARAWVVPRPPPGQPGEAANFCMSTATKCLHDAPRKPERNALRTRVLRSDAASGHPCTDATSTDAQKVRSWEPSLGVSSGM
mmetsp:Transcript_12880/g.29449  ORF Transcript_12880/g.29449 Transcript_12880/m.29449 type:complete len:100 (-) Transcript_12880:5-304(-)|eukprot:CAMPEP_0176192070 /NCGR_PEP_ID=MMETSP0121_2-20121125/4785_1 /TAXON_ID=160619 /ORGANISM="Kryptoperidinium foliaceum, Strain CCMP 1326" /LENGTH=99 /DNA_ID=CAMNT_0017530753 /DNA_START=19 /DNA_END=318 /DNA_ORIENTATION=+